MFVCFVFVFCFVLRRGVRKQQEIKNPSTHIFKAFPMVSKKQTPHHWAVELSLSLSDCSLLLAVPWADMIWARAAVWAGTAKWMAWLLPGTGLSTGTWRDVLVRGQEELALDGPSVI